MNLCTSCSLTNRKTLSEFSWTSTRPVVNAVRRSPNPMGTVDPLSVSIRGVLIGPSARILSPAKSAGERSGLFELKCLKPPDSHHPRTRIPVLVRRSSASFFPKGPSAVSGVARQVLLGQLAWPLPIPRQLLAAAADKFFSKGGNPKIGHPTSAPGPPHCQKPFQTKFPGMSP